VQWSARTLGPSFLIEGGGMTLSIGTDGDDAVERRPCAIDRPDAGEITLDKLGRGDAAGLEIPREFADTPLQLCKLRGARARFGGAP